MSSRVRRPGKGGGRRRGVVGDGGGKEERGDERRRGRECEEDEAKAYMHIDSVADS